MLKSKLVTGTALALLASSILISCNTLQQKPLETAQNHSSKSIDLLANGLSDWDTWLGVPHTTVKGLPAGTYQSDTVTKGTPFGPEDILDIFTIVEKNNEKILHVSGEMYAGLNTKDTYSNYHLRMQFKWGDQKFEPRLDKKRDSGLLYHCQGDHGAFWKVWKACPEYQIQEKDFGDFIPLGGVGASYKAKQDGKRNVFAPEATEYITSKNGYVHAEKEPDYPHGEWNTVDLYVVGDRAIHVVNGEVVFAIKDMLTVDDKPLTEGQIQLQSEAAECFYKNIVLTPISQLPTKFLKDAGFS